jgi:RNA polymerase sigma-70 factor (ECF subfamily)
MFVQAWGHYGTAWPVVAQQLGVRPDMGRRRLAVVPQLPSSAPIAGEDIRLGRGKLEHRESDESGRSSTSKMVMRGGWATGDERMERRMLEAAEAGDERAFRELVEIHRPKLQSHCYRMLGSLQDAEDAYQDTVLRAWRALEGFNRESSLGTWLYRIATNVCLSELRRAERRVLPMDISAPTDLGGAGAAPDESVRWIGPFPDAHLGLDAGREPGARYEQREAIELAFIAALQHLPPRQRAALLLADVLGFTAAEVGELLETTAAAISSALQRARATLRQRLPSRNQQTAAAVLGDRALATLAARFADAFEEGDVEAIIGLLTEDVTFEMPPYAEWARGRDDVARSWLMPARRPTGLRFVRTTVNGQLAFGAYSLDPELDRFLPRVLDVLELRGDRVCRIVAFRRTEAFARLGLPSSLPRHEPGDSPTLT